jgi:hypothetical protein
MKTRTVFFVVATNCLAACATHHYTIVSAEGHLQQRIVCRADTPGKCMRRAEDICGDYTIVQPLHELRGGEPRQLELLVECNPPMAASPSVAATPPHADPSSAPAATPAQP